MIKSKINPQSVKDLKWKEYVKLFQKDIQQAESKGVPKVPVVMISDFEFACGETHALVLIGKQSEMTKYYKSLKGDAQRKKMKDFSIGFCHFEKEENGSTAIKIGLSGFGKPAKMKKNSKKLIKKLGVNLKDIIKGEYTDEVVASIDEQNATATEEQKAAVLELQGQAEQMKSADDQANDTETLKAVARAFSKASKSMNLNVISLLKAAKSEAVTYTEQHIKIAEEAFRAAASLVDKYEEVASQDEQLVQKAKKITILKDTVVAKDLVNKYEKIWKRVELEYREQVSFIGSNIKEEGIISDLSIVTNLVDKILPKDFFDVDFESLQVSTDPPGDGWGFITKIIKQKISEVTNALFEAGVKVAKEIPNIIIRKELSDIKVDEVTGMAIIDSTKDAVIHYYTGKGRTVQLGDTTIDLIKNSTDMKRYRKRITEGLTPGPASGEVGIDMTNEKKAVTFHLGNMNLRYKTVCNENTCTTTYEVDDDGFVDPNVVGSFFGGDDSTGPNNELMGTPYDYETVQWTETYPNPGYKFTDDGTPLPIER